MQTNCSISLRFFLSENEFSIDELVTRIQELFSSEGGLAKLAAMIISLYQEFLFGKLFETGKMHGIDCCPGHRLVLNGSRTRTVQTSLGKIRLDLKRVRCPECGKTYTPMAKVLGLACHTRKSNEIEETVVEACANASYRTAVSQMTSHHLPFVPKSTAQRWVLRTDCAEIGVAGKNFDALGPVMLYGDGTGFKGVPEDGKAARGSLKVALAVDCMNNVVPLGVYTDKTWNEITDVWRKERVKFAPGSVSVTDGELGLAESLADFVDEQQRCQWHVDHDMYHMLRMDGVLGARSAPIRRKLRAIMGIDLPSEDYSPAAEGDREAIRSRMNEAEKAVDALVGDLRKKRYDKAAEYLERAQKGMFAYLRRWLALGIVCPRASSLIERVMRRLGLRLKKLGYGWSNVGAEKMAKIILKRFASEDEWQQYWKKVKNLEPVSVIANIVKIKVDSPAFKRA